MKPTEIKKLQARARKLRARMITRDTYVVESRSNPYAHHIVTIHGDGEGNIFTRCTCPWSQNGGYGCSHVMAALTEMAAQKRRAISFWGSLDEAKRQHQRILRLAGSRDEDAIYITSRTPGDRERQPQREPMSA